MRNQVISEESLVGYNRYYELEFGRQSVCSNKEINAIYAKGLAERLSLSTILELMVGRVGMPGWKGDSKQWPSFEELPII